MMRIGIDFDNTIVCYDNAIKELSGKLCGLPDDLPREKLHLKIFLKDQKRDQEWTSFQGELYGPGMKLATPFNGVIEAMIALQENGHTLNIISHRSRFPYAGTMYDLHSFAKRWIQDNLKEHGLFLNDSDVYFHEEKHQKISRAINLKVDAFVDDLVEILDEISTQLPKCKTLHFCPGISEIESDGKHLRRRRWSDIEESLGGI